MSILLSDYYNTIEYLFAEVDQKAIREAFNIQLSNIASRRGLTIVYGAYYPISLYRGDRLIHKSMIRVNEKDREWTEYKQYMSEIYQAEVRKGIFS